MRRPWMIVGLVLGSLGILVIALAPNIAVVLVGWCLAQVFFNAVLAAQAAVLPDQVPTAQRGTVAGAVGISLPVAAVFGTLVVTLFSPHLLAMFLAPCVAASVFIVLFAATLHDRRLPRDAKPVPGRGTWRTFVVNPREHPDFAWAFLSKFLFLMAFAFLTTYQAYYLRARLDTVKADVPEQVLTATAAQGAVLIVASLVGGRLSDRIGRRKVFVLCASAVMAVAMFVVAVSTQLVGFVIGAALSGLGLGLYVAVDFALIVDLLPDPDHVAKDLGLFNIAGALPYSLAPVVAPVLLAVSDDSYTVLYSVAGVSALLGAAAIMPIRAVR
jgi:MFS family permease